MKKLIVYYWIVTGLFWSMYAGLVFDLISAMYSFYASGTADNTTVFMIPPIALAGGSYWLYHKKLKAIV